MEPIDSNNSRIIKHATIINRDISQEPPKPPPKIYERAKDTAAKIRKRLKKDFPACKFSVRSEEYAGGNSVSISYVDGPALRTVERVAKAFESADFDAMQDLKTCPGYTDPETGERVSGADWVNVRRLYTKDVIMHAIRLVMAEHGHDADIAGPREATQIIEPISGHNFTLLAVGELATQDLNPYTGKLSEPWDDPNLFC